ncbi:sulfatase [Natronococcus pandeyae]|uniref:Sulfatase n=1 Tax=Natronococcus pandeyae TaxID=2055836 RepID=A0A8J8Q767_9EURY|nr:sulfatase [Natronococcus pandeyae]TYL38894.1 sulfatase [Natronococcus pandeyae]
MDPPNIVLVVMDTARAQDVLGREDVMPALHRIADDGVTFTNAFTTAPWTVPSHSSLFTGQYTSDHGSHAASKSFEPAIPTLAERLREDGYQTVAYSNNTWVSPAFGYDRGFEDFLVGWELFGSADLARIAKEANGFRERAAAVGKQLAGRDGYKTLCDALFANWRRVYDSGALVTNYRLERWFRSQRDPERPFFAFVNYIEPHLEYRPPRKFRSTFLPSDVSWPEAKSVNQDAWAYLTGHTEMDERDFEILEGLYRAELRYLDYRLEKLYDELRDLGELENTLLVVVGDHGENIGDHGLMDHQYCLYDTLTHVPLVVRHPSSFEPGRTREGLVELRDLYPTLLEAAGSTLDADKAASVSRRNLYDDGREFVISEYLSPQPSMKALERWMGEVPDKVRRRFDRGLRSIRTTEWKYIEGTDGSEELYDLAADPAESENVADDEPDVRAKLAAKIEAERGDLRRPTDDGSLSVDGSTKQRLEDMGYLQ